MVKRVPEKACAIGLGEHVKDTAAAACGGINRIIAGLNAAGITNNHSEFPFGKLIQQRLLVPGLLVSGLLVPGLLVPGLLVSGLLVSGLFSGFIGLYPPPGQYTINYHNSFYRLYPHISPDREAKAPAYTGRNYSAQVRAGRQATNRLYGNELFLLPSTVTSCSAVSVSFAGGLRRKRTGGEKARVGRRWYIVV